MGTVENGFIRYTLNSEYYYISLEDLELQDENLAEGEHVSVLFYKDDMCTGVRTNAEENLAASLMLATLILWCVILVAYVLVVRKSSWLKPWYDYLDYLKQQESPEKQLPIGARIVIYAIATVIALAICWPQIVSIVNNFQKMERIQQRQNVLQEGAVAGENAERLKEKLDKITNSPDDVETNEGVDKAGEAAGSIYSILNELNEETEVQDK